MQHDFLNLFRLTDQVALVTGAASGLGRAIATAYCEAGAAVVLADSDLTGAQDAAAQLSAEGATAFAVQCDVTKPESVNQAVSDTLSQFKRLDIMVANAGITARNAAKDLTEAQWDTVIDVDLKGVWLCNQAAGQHFIKENKAGCILNMSSVTAIVGIQTGNANYAAAKGGVAALTRTLAAEWGSRGIRVNALAPAQVKTHLIEDLLRNKPETARYFLNRIPLGRFGTPQEVAAAALFLVSPAASWITGHLLCVDGGNSILY